MERTLVLGIQPSVSGERGLPARFLSGGCVFLAFTGAFLKDRAKGSECVALALSWWLACLGRRVSRSGVQCGRAYCDRKSIRL